MLYLMLMLDIWQADVKSEGKIPMVTTLHGTDITLVGNHPFTSQQVLVSINLI
jgi:hypothetical protein